MNHKITCIIIDDEQEARDIIASLLEKFPEVEILDKLSNVDEGVVAFLKFKPQLVFLDVQMPVKDGFEFIHQIYEFDVDASIVFITAHHQYAIEAIKSSAFDYLLKPVSQTELLKTLERFKSKRQEQAIKPDFDNLLLQLKHHQRIKLNTRIGFELVDPECIMYIQADGNYSHIHCTSGNRMTSTQNLGNIEDLLKGESFFKISRSHIINTNFLTSVDRKHKTCKLTANGVGYELGIAKDRMRELEKFL